MKNNQKYVKMQEVIDHIDNDGLLVGNNAEWAKEAVNKSESILLDQYIPADRITNMIKYCEDKVSYYLYQVGSFAKAECYRNFINMLKTLSQEGDEG